MRPCENVIVTVWLNRECMDMELPAFLPIRELAKRMDETFRTMFPHLEGARDHLVLLHDGKHLDERSTLASCGVWDGSVLTCNYGEEAVR